MEMQKVHVLSQPIQKERTNIFHREMFGELGVISMQMLHVS